MGKPVVDIDILALSPAQRLDLIEALWDSLSDEGVPLTEEQREELHRRSDCLDAEGPVGVSWEQLRDRLGRPDG